MGTRYWLAEVTRRKLRQDGCYIPADVSRRAGDGSRPTKEATQRIRRGLQCLGGRSVYGAEIGVSVTCVESSDSVGFKARNKLYSLTSRATRLNNLETKLCLSAAK